MSRGGSRRVLKGQEGNDIDSECFYSVQKDSEQQIHRVLQNLHNSGADEDGKVDLIPEKITRKNM